MVRSFHDLRDMLQRITLLALFGLLVLTSPAALAIVKTQTVQTRSWETVDGVLRAVQARVSVQPAHIDREYVGAIVLRPDGTFHYTWGQGADGHDQVTFSVALRAGERLMASWHTHGTPGWGREFFSRADAEMVRQMELPLYLLAPSGAIKVLTPEEAEQRAASLRPVGSSQRLKGWAGRPVRLKTA